MRYCGCSGEEAAVESTGGCIWVPIKFGSVAPQLLSGPTEVGCDRSHDCLQLCSQPRWLDFSQNQQMCSKEQLELEHSRFWFQL